jgi:hypothetical protein
VNEAAVLSSIHSAAILSESPSPLELEVIEETKRPLSCWGVLWS